MTRFALILFSFLFVLSALGQDEDYYDGSGSADTTWRIITNTGSVYLGKIEKDDGREVTFISESVGKIIFQKTNLKKIQIHSVDGVEAFRGPIIEEIHVGEYGLAQTGRGPG